MSVAPTRDLPISTRWRLCWSVLLIGHLIAVVGPPLAFQTRGPRGVSPSVLAMVGMMRGYGQFFYLDRGYAFFAPDPGPSHLIRATLTRSGESPAMRWFPDLNQQWPRLLYHRHFMLSEFLNDNFQPALPRDVGSLVGEALPVQELALWRAGRNRFDRIASSMTKHLRVHYRSDTVTLDRVEHQLPDFVRFSREPISLTDPTLYVVLPDEPISLDELRNLGGPSLEPVPPPALSQPEPGTIGPVEVKKKAAIPTGATS